MTVRTDGISQPHEMIEYQKDISSQRSFEDSYRSTNSQQMLISVV